jgi:hypothetical protein
MQAWIKARGEEAVKMGAKPHNQAPKEEKECTLTHSNTSDWRKALERMMSL